MNEIISTYLLARDKFMSVMQQKALWIFRVVFLHHLLKAKKEYKTLKKQEIQDIS